MIYCSVFVIRRVVIQGFFWQLSQSLLEWPAVVMALMCSVSGFICFQAQREIALFLIVDGLMPD